MTYVDLSKDVRQRTGQDGSGRVVVQGLTKQFRSINAVNDLSFVVEPGTVTGFLGPNGSGKTTTLRMVLGLVAPTSGTATISGVPYAHLGNPARVVGAVLDSQGFHRNRSARAHLRVYTAAMGLPDATADHVLDLVGLTAAAKRKAGGFSLGMRQRLALATALLGDPQVLVLDEPSNGLDPEGIAWLRNFLKGFAGAGRTVLVSSHLLREVEQTVDSLLIISRGTCVYRGTMDQLRAGQRSRVLVACSDASALATALVATGTSDVTGLPDGRLAVTGTDVRHVGTVALDARVAVYGMQLEQADLEQVFFALTAGQYAGAPQGGGHPPQGYRPPPGYGPSPGYGPAPGHGQGQQGWVQR